MQSDPSDQHNQEIHENLRHWRRKPLLQQEYARFYQRIARALAPVPTGEILECGSGIGNLKSVLPAAITSDLFANPWLDRIENVYSLTFPDVSLSGVVLFDVFHHLRYPGTALDEIYRVLRPGGRVVIFEPAMGVLGRTVLGLFHHEPLGLRQPITWRAPEGFVAAEAGYYAAQANAWKVFGRPDHAARLTAWQRVEVTYFPALSWLLTGGFRGPQLLTPPLQPIVNLLETAVCAVSSRLFASRMLVVLQKPAESLTQG